MIPDLASRPVILAFTAVNVVFLLYLLIRWRRARGDASGPKGAVDGEAAGERIVCSECGAPNDPRYRFCRRCVAELPSGVSDEVPGSGVSGQKS
ncbi:MAG: hypothetical protein ACI9YT_000500 [Halobacteriales archaeon]|jgi:hypothetical protein